MIRLTAAGKIPTPAMMLSMAPKFPSFFYANPLGKRVLYMVKSLENCARMSQ
jgi:hypothetical protein